MEKKIFVIGATVFFILASTEGNCQPREIIRAGLLKSDLTFSPSYNFASKSTSYFLHGVFEGYMNKQVSATGEGYYQISNPDKSQFDYNHSLFFGLSYHLARGQNDLFLGIQPGFSISQLKNPEESSVTGINPLVSAIAGYNFYLNKIFHFFIQSRILTGTHNYNHSESLAEFRMSAGLGYNINTVKVKRNY